MTKFFWQIYNASGEVPEALEPTNLRLQLEE